MQNFYNNLNSLHETLLNHPNFGPRFLYLHEKYTGYAPSFRCDVSNVETKLSKKSNLLVNQKVLNVYTIQERTTSFINNFYYGLIECSANYLWHLDVKLDKIKNSQLIVGLKLQVEKNENDSSNLFDLRTSPYILGYSVRIKTKYLEKSNPNQFNKILHENFTTANEFSENPMDLCLGVEIFKSIFPFTILIDRNMKICQLGDGLMKYLANFINKGYGFNFSTYFSIIKPKLNEHTFESLLINQNMSYSLKMNSIESHKDNQFEEMELKGSIVYLEENECLIFIGSPVILHLEELTGRGLYISDIPIHDATRDIILVGEQTKAQEGLKFRMEKLKKSIVKAHEDIEQEKQKNIELLNMIFPSDIAQKLWGGMTV